MWFKFMHEGSQSSINFLAVGYIDQPANSLVSKSLSYQLCCANVFVNLPPKQ